MKKDDIDTGDVDIQQNCLVNIISCEGMFCCLIAVNSAKDHSSSLPTQHGILRTEDLCIGNGTNHFAGVEALTPMN